MRAISESGSEIYEMSSISGLDRSIHYRTDTIREGMKQSIVLNSRINMAL